MIRRPYNAIRLTLTVLALIGLSTTTANAGWFDTIIDTESLVASFMNIFIVGMGWILAMAGGLLNISINLTLHIRDFVTSTPGIYATWKTIRDISGMFIIFFLLYAAIKMILGFDAKFGTLIKNIVIAGVLINFSFFFASLGIDASNIVSMQIYNAIAPTGSLDPDAITTNIFEYSASAGGQTVRFGDGGLSDVFMNSLKIQRVHNIQLAGSGGAASAEEIDISGPFKIILAGITAILIELAAALSFGAAALAFVIRFAVLLLLLAFSPIWFAAQIIPEVKEYADKWVKAYKGMLIFMPVYLLLMYLALSVLTTSPLLNATGGGTVGATTSLITLAVNAVIVIVLINMPLVAAMSLAGTATSFINTKTLGAGNIWRKFGTGTYHNTVGRATSKIAQSETFKDAAARSNLAALALRGTRVASSGYDAKLNKQINAQTEFAESLGYNKGAYREEERKLRELRTQQSNLRAQGDMAGAKALNNRIERAEENVDNVRTSRSRQYASTISSRDHETLWVKVARKNKVAAAKIESNVVNKRLEKAKKDLEKAREKIKETQKKIDDLEQSIKSGNAKDENKSRATIAELENNLRDLYDKEGEAIENVEMLNAQASAYDSIS